MKTNDPMLTMEITLVLVKQFCPLFDSFNAESKKIVLDGFLGFTETEIMPLINGG